MSAFNPRAGVSSDHLSLLPGLSAWVGQNSAVRMVATAQLPVDPPIGGIAMALAEQPHAEKLVVRGTALLLMVPTLLLFAVGCVGLSVDSFRTAAGSLDILKGAGAALAVPLFLWLCVRTALGGIRADSRGVEIRNVWSKHYIPWNEVKDVVIHQESGEGVGAYVLRFQLAGGYVASTFPEVWGSGNLLERRRLALLGLRDSAVEGRSD